MARVNPVYPDYGKRDGITKITETKYHRNAISFLGNEGAQHGSHEGRTRQVEKEVGFSRLSTT